MISAELNERLTQTGPGTPMGNLLRRYWQPIGTRVELEKEPVQPIRLLSGQGPMSDRTGEHLATSDKGIILYRDLLLKEVARVERGEDPRGTLRDAAQNFPAIQIRTETQARRAFGLEEPAGPTR